MHDGQRAGHRRDATADERVIWSDLLSGKPAADGKTHRRLIVVQPKLNFTSLNPAAAAMDAVTELSKKLDLTEAHGLSVRMTGSAALAEDELRSVQDGMGLAGALSVVLVLGILAFGLRSPGAIMSLLVTLAVGLLWTAALAIVLYGRLNLISVAFAVLFVGLSVDFGIHFVLRALETASRTSWADALPNAGRAVGPALALCALTTAIGFLSFSPTDYAGLAELGTISAVGIGVALLANLTLLPALLRFLGGSPPAPKPMFRSATRLSALLRSRARLVAALAAVSAVLALLAAPLARFDFDPMNLRDAESPSVRTLFDLVQSGDAHPYSIDILTADLPSAKDMAARLAKLPLVDAVESVWTLVPENQPEKAEVISSMALFLAPAFFTEPGSVGMTGPGLDAAAAGLRSGLGRLSAKGGELGEMAKRLNVALSSGAKLPTINTALFSALPGRLTALKTALEAAPFGIEDLPPSLAGRHVAADGRVKIEVLPKEDLRDAAALALFSETVRTVAPNATGAPVIIVEAGRAVVRAFAVAMLISVIGISIVLWFALRRIRDVVLVFVPVFLAALWTVAVAGLAGLQFNFANVIVLPLLFGLSVDFGTHIVLREREGASDGAFETSTPLAVLLSALTTIGSFSSIMLSGHTGTASMGMLLSISITLSLAAILLVLPALLALVGPMRVGGGR